MSTLDENANCARTYASFRVIGDGFDPETVTAALGVNPTSGLAGDAGSLGNVGMVVWSYSTRDTIESTSLERHLLHLLDVVSPAATVLGDLRARHDIEASFLCFWRSATGHGGPCIGPNTLRRIADLGAGLDMDFYG